MVAENKAPKDFEVFLLDKPVCLNKGIWHQAISLSETSCFMITENLEVTSEIYTLVNELSADIIF